MLLKNVKKIQCFFMLAYTTSKQCNQFVSLKRGKSEHIMLETVKELYKFLLFNTRITKQCCKQSCD